MNSQHTSHQQYTINNTSMSSKFTAKLYCTNGITTDLPIKIINSLGKRVVFKIKIKANPHNSYIILSNAGKQIYQFDAPKKCPKSDQGCPCKEFVIKIMSKQTK